MSSSIPLKEAGAACATQAEKVANVAAAAAVNEADLSPEEMAELRKQRKLEAKAAKANKAAEKVKPTWGQPKAEGEEKKEKKKPVKEEFVEPAMGVTVDGEKKNLSHPMERGYDSSRVEKSWASYWEKQGFFTPDSKKFKNTVPSRVFTMVIPPPNVTGSLHIGHTLTDAIEDTKTRWHRMRGDVTLWVPGIDHAGIATQTVVERQLAKLENKTRHDLGREKFLERVWQWKEQYGGHIKLQTQKLGCSVDWTREAFTLDAARSKAVKEAFVRMYESGLIYRDTRLVSWCPHLRTALSDIEVDTMEVPEPMTVNIPGLKMGVEVGVLQHFLYKVKGSEETIEVATTRIETMLGDVAVAVNPNDSRYTHLIGKELVHPFVADRLVKVVADADLVDMAFGTGAVKITPAHDANDFQCGKRHQLPFINILTEDGKINAVGGELFAGMHRFEARVKVIEELEKLGLYKGKSPNPMAIGICSRSGDIIEPFLIPQWWVNCKDMAARAVDAVKTKQLKIVPDFHEQTWFNWLCNIQDWCISRQLWWGHRIPAYKIVAPVLPEGTPEPKQWVVGRDEAEAIEEAKKRLTEMGLDVSALKLNQDEDVLDTWFSSGLFPFSTMNWPEQSDDLDLFFPNTLLETGHDILFFWVARMVMMSLQLTDKLPFHTVYLHAMVRDKFGNKMSKSSGNVIDPLEVIDGISLDDMLAKLKSGNLRESEVERAIEAKKEEFPNGIPACGADALRYGLLSYTRQGRNINLDVNHVVGYRQFCNKLWNATRFALQKFPENFSAKGINNYTLLTTEDQWILHCLSKAASASNKAIEEYAFSDAVSQTYNFWLYQFCDVYLELFKPRVRAVLPEGETHTPAEIAALEVLYYCLDVGLRMLHPMTPFVTEELYQRIPSSLWKNDTITLAPYPTGIAAHMNPHIEQTMDVFNKVVAAIRSFVTSTGVPASEARVYFDISKVVLETNTPTPVLPTQALTTLTKTASVKDVKDVEQGRKILADVGVSGVTVYLDISDLNEEALANLKVRFEKKLAQAMNDLQKVEKKRNLPGYNEKASAEGKENDTRTFNEATLAIEKLKESLSLF